MYDSIQKVENVYRFTERGWGLEEKFRKLNDSEVKKFGSVLLDLLSKNEQKQFSCIDLFEYLKSFQVIRIFPQK